ncbi:hypothetical protein J6590_103998 [Homalodisca vitripennis]|nr:hypothetical protein J6590_103998 [Homalodisca vitripennis]
MSCIVSTTYPVSPRGGRQTLRPYIINKITAIVDPLAYCLINQNGEFCSGRSPSLLPSQSRRGVLFRQAP